MTWNAWDVLIILLFLLNLAALAGVAVVALKIKNGPVAAVTGRVKPMIAKGRGLAVTGQRELMQNKDRFQALAEEIKGVAAAVRPAGGTGEKSAIDYRMLLTGFSILRTVGSGWKQIQAARNPMANPPGPAKAKKKASPRRLGIVPDVVRLLLEVRRGLMTGR